MPEFYFHLLHPKLVHFPIAFFIGALGLEIIALMFKNENLHRSALTLYVAAALITPVVVWSGLEEAEHLNLHHPILDLHRRFALLTMWGALITLPVFWIIHRRSKNIFRVIFLVCAVMIVAFVTMAGHNGGRMVYEYGVGVEE